MPTNRVKKCSETSLQFACPEVTEILGINYQLKIVLLLNFNYFI